MTNQVVARTTLILAAVALAGCTGGELDVAGGNALDHPNEAHIEHGEVSYLGEGFDEGAPEVGYHEMIPDKPFRGVSFMLTSPMPWSEYSVQREDGTWSDFEPMGYDWNYRKFQNDYLEFDQPVRGFRLKFDDPSAEFLRLEFHDAPVGEADPHDDSLVDFITEAVNEILGNALAVSGRWMLPSSVASAGARQSVGYDSAPSYSQSNCSGRLTDGARAMGDYLTDNFRGAKYFQGYNCRRIRGSSRMSMHGTGRAVDVFVPLDRGRADNDLGDEVANFLIENAEVLGVQLVIWDRTIWSKSRGARQYSGTHPHHDHIHLEITREASRKDRIDLRRTPAPAPTPTPQPEPTPDPQDPAPTPTPTPNQPPPRLVAGPAWVGTACSDDAHCDFSADGQSGFCWTFQDNSTFVDRGFCALRCEGLCPDKVGEAYTFCVAADSANAGICVSRSATQNNYCGEIPGTVPTQTLRYVGDAAVTVRQRAVCLP